MRRFLLLQLRPETEAADGEYTAFLSKGGLTAEEVHRIRLDKEPLPADLRLSEYAGVIVGGGPGCISDAPHQKTPVEAKIEAAMLGLMPEITAQDVPFLGCCYGIGVLAHHLGAEVSKRRYGEEIGAVVCAKTVDGHQDPLLRDLPDSFDALVGHKEAVQGLPDGTVHLLSSDTCPFQMIRHGKNVYATQFHPEADGEEFAARVRIYRDRGYFAPEAADRLAAHCLGLRVSAPPKILRRFVQTYRSGLGR